MNQKNQQELQQKIIEINLLDQKCKEIQQQITMIDQQLTELQLLQNNLNEIGKIKDNSETLSQLGQGIFVKSKISKSDEIYIDIGSKIVIKKTPEEAREVIQKRIEQMTNVRDLIIQELNNIVLNIQVIEKELQQSMQKDTTK